MFGDFRTCATRMEEVSEMCVRAQVMRLREYFTQSTATQPVAHRWVSVIITGHVGTQKVTAGLCPLSKVIGCFQNVYTLQHCW